MKILVIGSGGREHAMAWALARSPRVEQVYCAPGNAGTAQCGTNLAISPDDHAGLLDAARRLEIDLAVVGPERPLCEGIADRFAAHGLRVFGPSAAAARIEGDKAYAKRLMKTAKVPTAEARIFDRYPGAREYIATRDTGVVVKASGLAGGKGVCVCPDPSDALLAAERFMVHKALGAAGETIVVEELLQGREMSVFALVSGQTIYVLEAAVDYKRIGEGDTGPNTGGMGALSPVPFATPEVMRSVERDVLVPIVDALRREGVEYRGVLYVGLMLTAAGPKVLEFNCRFGDPEAQVLFPRIETDAAALLQAVVDDRLDGLDLRMSPRAAVCVVLASRGYPGEHEQGRIIRGLEAAAMSDVQVFHGATQWLDGQVVTRGGRVLGVMGLGDDLAEARDRAYQAAERIRFEGAYYRRDIAAFSPIEGRGSVVSQS